MLTNKEIEELRLLKKDIQKCKVRISNTLNPATEERILKELIPLEKRKSELDKKLES